MLRPASGAGHIPITKNAVLVMRTRGSQSQARTPRTPHWVPEPPTPCSGAEDLYAREPDSIGSQDTVWGRWPEKLWKARKLTHETYEEYLYAC